MGSGRSGWASTKSKIEVADSIEGASGGGALLRYRDAKHRARLAVSAAHSRLPNLLLKDSGQADGNLTLVIWRSRSVDMSLVPSVPSR